MSKNLKNQSSISSQKNDMKLIKAIKDGVRNGTINKAKLKNLISLFGENDPNTTNLVFESVFGDC